MRVFLSTMQSAVVIITVVFFTTIAQAHTGDDPHDGWQHGFIHPLNGLDHLLAMIAVGVWSMQLSSHMGKRAIWLMPVIFVLAMGFGGLLGFVAFPFIFVEHGIALSLLIIGFLIARSVQLPILAGMLLIAMFAVFHGYAHGNEIPDGAAIQDYAAGFMLATALLHFLGIGLAFLVYHFRRDHWLRYAGVAVALSGGVMLAGGAG